MSDFNSLGLGAPLLKALHDAGYTSPTPIQAQSIRPILEGRDLLGIAQTGTGKTAAFALPLLERLGQQGGRVAPGQVRVLVLTPTRELAAQVEASFRKYGSHLRLRTAVIFGGVGQDRQVQALRGGLDVLIATPGRLLDLMGQGYARLGQVEVFVLDEADRMLDMGFIRDIKKVVAVLPSRRQTLLFSATMPGEIADLAHEQLKDPVRVEVTPPATTVERIAQSLVFVDKSRKRDLLRHCLEDRSIAQALVFTRTKRGADRVAEDLEKHGVSAGAIHGNKAQNHRERTLKAFRSGQLRVLVATDIAARGLDIPGVSHVFNYELPDEPESYVHRIGRTARAGRDGVAVAFCCSEELEQLRDIERTIGLTLELDESSPYAVALQRLPERGRGGQPQASRKPARPQGGHQHQGRHQGRGPQPQASRSPQGQGNLRSDLGERRSGEQRPQSAEPRREQGQRSGEARREQRPGPGAGHVQPQGQGGGNRRRRRRGRGGQGGPGGNATQGGGFLGGMFKAIKRGLGG